MNKTEKYLYKRLDALSEEKVTLITKINKITIEIEEVEGKIEEMSNEVDIAFEIFSPKPKKNDFNKAEIDKLNVRREELSNLRDEFVKQCMVVEEDIVEIKDSLGEEFDEEFVYEEVDKEEMVYGFKILDQQEIEKQDLAKKINDSTVSVLNNTIHKCDTCTRIMDMDVVRAKLELEIISKSLKDVLEDIKGIIYELKPAEYKDIKLELALERMVNLLRLNTDMMVNLNISGDKYSIPSIIEMTLFRIISEACNNSVKYSGGSALNINVIFDEEYVKVEVADDGKGIDFENVITDSGELDSFGLTMMREKTYLLGGQIDFISNEKGTLIKIYIPLNN